MLKFPGRRPQNLGAVNGRFSAPPTWKPNWVSSQVPTADPHYTAPLATGGGAQELLARLKDAIEGMDGAAIIAARPDYLHAEFTTAPCCTCARPRGSASATSASIASA
jgi:uncharacterized protein (DUF1499 family)